MSHGYDLSAPSPAAVCTPETIGIGLARVGQDTQRIVSGPLSELLKVDFGPPLHSLVLAAPGQHLHELETDMLKRLSIKDGVTPMLPAVEAAKSGAGCASDSDE